MGLLVRVGEGCKRLHDRLVRGLAIHRIETDELVTTLHTREIHLKGYPREGRSEAAIGAAASR